MRKLNESIAIKTLLRTFIISSLVNSGTAFPQTFDPKSSLVSGNELLELCTQADRQFCFGYLSGFLDMYTFSEEAITKSFPEVKPPICVPSGVTPRQLADTIILFLEQHPSQRHYTAASEASDALMGAFPCAN